MTDLCQICGEREADYEETICEECKMKQDRLNREEELKACEEDMLSYNHKGEWCWLTGKTYCQEGWCSECAIYLDWKQSLKEVSSAKNTHRVG